MNDFLDKVGAGFTPARRKVIYHVAFAGCLLLTFRGVITAKDAGEYLTCIAYVLFGGVTQMAAANVKEDE